MVNESQVLNNFLLPFFLTFKLTFKRAQNILSARNLSQANRFGKETLNKKIEYLDQLVSDSSFFIIDALLRVHDCKSEM